jgi:hypothetical protein
VLILFILFFLVVKPLCPLHAAPTPGVIVAGVHKIH